VDPEAGYQPRLPPDLWEMKGKLDALYDRLVPLGATYYIMGRSSEVTGKESARCGRCGHAWTVTVDPDGHGRPSRCPHCRIEFLDVSDPNELCSSPTSDTEPQSPSSSS